MKRHLIIAGALWVALTAAGEALALLVDFYPIARSDKGEEIERAFRILLIMAVPVFTMVVAVLVYSVLARRTAGPLAGEGPRIVWWTASSELTPTSCGRCGSSRIASGWWWHYASCWSCRRKKPPLSSASLRGQSRLTFTERSPRCACA